jgi:UDP-GlcNAc:undecaprenyl-phosphate GlcNAc-1-phosphate transferase
MDMTTLVFVSALSFALCYVLTPLVRYLAARVGLVDRPDRLRKLHAQATPVAGGIGILLSASLALGLACLLPGPLAEQLPQEGQTLPGLLPGAVVICVVGVLDDFRGLRGRHKLLGQILAASFVVASGLVVNQIHIFGWQVDLGPLALPFTFCWLLGAINSLNLLDGMDGMLSSVSLILCLAFGTLALLGGHAVPACVALALAGAVLAFLRYNFPPASIFLGDSGSMLIGLVVGTLAIQSSLKGPAVIALTAPLAVLAVPLFDTTMAVLRRKLTGRSLYTTDRGHLHHCLLRRGLSNRRALLLVACSCLATAAAAVVSLALHNELLAIVLPLAVLGLLVVTRLFGYAEFQLVQARLASLTAPWQWAEDGTRQMRVRLQGALNWDGLWDRLTWCAQELNLSELTLDVNAPSLHESFFARWRRPDTQDQAQCWRAELPLTTAGPSLGRIRVSGPDDGQFLGDKVAVLSGVLAAYNPIQTGATVSRGPHGAKRRTTVVLNES